VELYVFNFNFERIGMIDSYQSLEFTINYKKHSELDLVVDATPENISYFLDNSDDVILTKSDDITHGYIIDSAKYSDDTKSTIDIYCKSLSYLLNRRIIENQQTYKGTIEDTLRYFVANNAIVPTNTNRMIPNLIVGRLKGFTTSTDEAVSNKYLDESLWEICIKFDVAYEIIMDHSVKKFLFEVYQGADLTTEQTINEPVIFSKEFDNVLSQNYVDDKSDYRNVCIIAGEGEGTARTYLVVNDTVTGLDRREMFVDARDLQSENEDETMISQAEYEAMLTERAKTKLAENERVRTFETEVDYNSQFLYGTDYACGDKVTIRNDEIGVVMHTRIVTATEKYNKNGFELNIEFGSNVPKLLDKIKKVVK
jgi:Siphovirus ReqiPepy6 Gp37-like protein